MKLYRTVTVIVYVLTIIACLSFYQGVTTDRKQSPYIQMNNDEQAYLDMSADYDLVWGMTRGIADRSVIASSPGLIVRSYFKDGADRVMNVVNSGDDAEAVVPLFDFGNYHAFDMEKGEDFSTGRSDVNARLAVKIPKGFSGSVRISYIPPVYWHVAEAISLIAWLTVSGYAVCLFRVGRKHDGKKGELV